MQLYIHDTPAALGKAAADRAAALLNDAIAAKGSAVLLLSTGASQFDFFENLVLCEVDWGKVTMFHLDEYVGLPQSHPASFRRYLNERFVSRVGLGQVFFVDGEGDAGEVTAALAEAIGGVTVDLGVVGIGENGHIAFNDPPADFDTQQPYIVVELDEKCKAQQVREGWFENLDAVPRQAITMSVSRILNCEKIISVVPHAVKAAAVRDTLTLPITPQIPAAALRNHPCWELFLDTASASLLDR